MITKDSNNENQTICDGCGRVNGGPDTPMNIVAYPVHDPNSNVEVEHTYCGMCARNRGLTDVLSTVIPGWRVVNPPTVGPGETQEEHDAAMRGESQSVNNGISEQYVGAVGDAEAAGDDATE